MIGLAGRPQPADVWWRAAPAAPAPVARPAVAGRREADPESAIPFAALLVFTFILLIGPQLLVPALAELRIALVAASAAGLALLVDRVGRRRPLTIRARHFWLAGGLLAWSVVTIPLSFWPGGSLHFLLEVYLKSLVVFWLLANVLSTTVRLRRLAWTLTILSVPIALTGLGNYIAGEYVKNTVVQRITGYDAPLTGNPNDLALMLNLLIPIMVALVLETTSARARWVLLAVLTVNVAAVIVTFSRAGFLTLAAVALAYAWKLRRRAQLRWIVLVLVVALCALPLVPRGYFDRMASTIETQLDRTGSAQARRSDMLTGLYFAATHPIAGAGIGQDTLALNRERGERWTAIHNVYLQHAVDLGLPGLVLFIMLLRACLASARRVEQWAAQDPPRRDLGRLAGGIHVSLIAYAVGALFHPVAYNFYFYYVAGMAVALEAVAHSAGSIRARSAS